MKIESAEMKQNKILIQSQSVYITKLCTINHEKQQLLKETEVMRYSIA